MGSKVLKFPQEREPFDQFLDELRKAYDEDRLREFICIYEARYPKGEERKGFVGTIDKYWFGESTTQGLGLCRIMEQHILDFVVERNREDNEG